MLNPMRILLLIAFGIFLSTLLPAQTQCNVYFPFEKGAKMEYTSYDKKDRPEATMTHYVVSLEETGEGVMAEVETKMQDKKGKNAFDGSYTVRCKDNTLYMDMSNFLPQEMMESMGDMEAEVEGDGMVIPENLEVGQTLPDASTSIDMSSGTLGNLMKMTVNVVNRKVQRKESVITPAGTFDCYKITYDTEMKTIMKKTFSSAEWYAEGVGMVKSENYKKNGKVDSYMLLTKLEK